MLEINLPDSHFGKLAWGIETGYGNYDVKIAEKIYWEALETLLSRVAHHKFSSVLYVVGNDLINADDIEGRTTGGTYVSSDARYHKTFAAVRTVMINSIERLRQVAPVKVVIVSGNHDQLSCWHLGDSLECFFNKYKDVEIDNLPRARKYHQHGNVMLMLCHGHKGKRDDYPLLMATEQSKMFGETKFRECHTGHIHKTKLDEQHGVRVRILPALTEVDDWLATNGFVGNLRNAEAYVWSAEEGLIEQVYYTVPE
jgi:predicted phosphodiesterase